MKLPRFFKTPKHQSFDYIPMHYDKVQEGIESQKKYYSKESSNAEMLKGRISSGFSIKTRGSGRKNNSYQAQVRKANYLRLAIMFILIFLTYYVIKIYVPVLSAWIAQ